MVLTAQQLQQGEQGDAFRSVVDAAQQQALGQGTSAAGNVKRQSSGEAANQPAAGAAAKASKCGSQQPAGSRGAQSAAASASRTTLSGSPSMLLSRSAMPPQPLPDEPLEVELSLLPSRSYALDAAEVAAGGPASGGSSLAADGASQAARPAMTRRRSASLPYPHAAAGRRCRCLACCSAGLPAATSNM